MNADRELGELPRNPGEHLTADAHRRHLAGGRYIGRISNAGDHCELAHKGAGADGRSHLIFVDPNITFAGKNEVAGMTFIPGAHDRVARMEGEPLTSKGEKLEMRVLAFGEKRDPSEQLDIRPDAHRPRPFR